MDEAAPGALLGAGEVRRLAADVGVSPTKRLGQNFVVDANTVRRIVRAAQVSGEDVVLEVGPGLGSLTLGLLATGARVVAVEIDPVLATAVPRTVSTRMPAAPPRLEVVTGDALVVDRLPGPPPTTFVANLPYNVAVPVVLHVLATWPSIAAGLVMVQAEVADRMTAAPGSRIYGVPSVKTAWWATATRAGAIPRTVFWPVPNVDSALVRLVRHDPPDVPVERAEVFAVIDAAFAQRRKSLRAALSALAGSPDAAADAARAAGIDPAARGESLDVHAFARLTQALRAVRSSS